VRRNRLNRGRAFVTRKSSAPIPCSPPISRPRALPSPKIVFTSTCGARIPRTRARACR
jgi:hypothetical protein